MRLTPLFSALLLGVCALAGAGIYQALHPKPTSIALPHAPLSEEASKVSSSVPLGGPFQLIDHTGQPRTEKSFGSKYLLVYFGYSYCPDICPMALTSLSHVMETLDPKAEKFQPLFISVDPKRDTVENLALYAQNFHPTFCMLTGTPENIKKVCKHYRVYAAAQTKADSTEELIDHSSIIYVMNPQGEFVAHFNHQTPAEEIIKGLERFV